MFHGIGFGVPAAICLAALPWAAKDWKKVAVAAAFSFLLLLPFALSADVHSLVTSIAADLGLAGKGVRLPSLFILLYLALRGRSPAGAFVGAFAACLAADVLATSTGLIPRGVVGAEGLLDALVLQPVLAAEVVWLANTLTRINIGYSS